MNVTRTNLANGKYQYHLDGEVWIRSSTVLYTHATRFHYDHQNGNSGYLAYLHKTGAAALSKSVWNGQGKEWPRVDFVEVDGVEYV